MIGNRATLRFETTTADITRSSSNPDDYFEKLNVQLFDALGDKVLDKVCTQEVGDVDDFGSVELQLADGTYSVVAVGHSSIKSATIKSTQMVQFTASDGEKLTDTFCYCGSISVSDGHRQFDLTMNRVAAKFRVVMTDDDIPPQLAKIKFDYTGGSANFNPSTGMGCTKSTQSETRAVSTDGIYEIYTFPYQSDICKLKVTLSALTADGTIIYKRTFEDVPVTRNRITTYRGEVFGEGGGQLTQTGFGFVVNGDWEGEDIYEF